MCVYVICAHNVHAWLYACVDTEVYKYIMGILCRVYINSMY